MDGWTFAEIETTSTTCYYADESNERVSTYIKRAIYHKHHRAYG